MGTWVFFISAFLFCGIAKSIPGGWSPVTNLTSPYMLEIGSEATDLVSESMNSPNHMKFIKIIKGEKQVVSGMKYRLDVVMGPTECKKNQDYSSQEIQNCPLQENQESFVCNVSLWVQPWKEQKYHLLNSTCTQDESSS